MSKKMRAGGMHEFEQPAEGYGIKNIKANKKDQGHQGAHKSAKQGPAK